MNARRAADEVLAFWFGAPPSVQPRPEWFRKDAAFDTQVRQRFGAVIDTALAGGLADWAATPAGARQASPAASCRAKRTRPSAIRTTRLAALRAWMTTCEAPAEAP